MVLVEVEEQKLLWVGRFYTHAAGQHHAADHHLTTLGQITTSPRLAPMHSLATLDYSLFGRAIHWGDTYAPVADHHLASLSSHSFTGHPRLFSI